MTKKHLGRARLFFEQTSEGTSRDLSGRMQSMILLAEESLPLQEQLGRFQPHYPAARSLDELERTCVGLRTGLRSLSARLDKGFSEWTPLYETEYQRRMNLVLAAGGGDAALKPTWASGLLDFDFSVKNLNSNLKSFLVHDETLRRRAEETLRRRLLRGRAVLWSSALSAMAFFFWLRRRRQRPASATPSQASEPLLSGAEGAAASWVLGGNFRVLGELGRGGMGVVYEALDQTLRRKVAVKKMREEIRQSPRDLEMFLSEARLVAGLKHPHIVEIHGVVREGAEVYLVFEFVQGRPLSGWLEKGPLTPDTLRGLFAHVAAALDYAHSRRVIHRDLKPSNIMVTDDRIAKVMDFGLAHQAKMTVARLTRAAAAGTPAYMAPEQEMGSVSRESDLYALGVCLYEMAVGRLPFEGPNFLAQKRALLYTPPSRSGLPAALDGVIARALQPEPQNRFHSAAELLAALDAAGAGRG